MTGALLREGEETPRGEGHKRTKAQMGALGLHAKEHQGLPTAARIWEKDGGQTDPPRSLQSERGPAGALGFGPRASRTERE